MCGARTGQCIAEAFGVSGESDQDKRAYSLSKPLAQLLDEVRPEICQLLVGLGTRAQRLTFVGDIVKRRSLPRRRLMLSPRTRVRKTSRLPRPQSRAETS